MPGGISGISFVSSIESRFQICQKRSVPVAVQGSRQHQPQDHSSRRPCTEMKSISLDYFPNLLERIVPAPSTHIHRMELRILAKGYWLHCSHLQGNVADHSEAKHYICTCHTLRGNQLIQKFHCHQNSWACCLVYRIFRIARSHYSLKGKVLHERIIDVKLFFYLFIFGSLNAKFMEQPIVFSR